MKESSSLEVDTRLQGGERLPLVTLTLAEPCALENVWSCTEAVVFLCLFPFLKYNS